MAFWGDDLTTSLVVVTGVNDGEGKEGWDKTREIYISTLNTDSLTLAEQEGVRQKHKTRRHIQSYGHTAHEKVFSSLAVTAVVMTTGGVNCITRAAVFVVAATARAPLPHVKVNNFLYFSLPPFKELCIFIYLHKFSPRSTNT